MGFAWKWLLPAAARQPVRDRRRDRGRRHREDAAMSFIPGIGIVRGMGLTLRRFFEPKATINYPEVKADVPPKFRGRLQLLYDEYGTLKCETCFQCAQACPIECIDMGGMDTKGRFHVHWGPRRDVRRAARGIGAPAIRPDRPGSGVRPLRGPSTWPPSTRSSTSTTTTRAPARDPRGDARPTTATCPSRRSSGSASSPAPGTPRSTGRRRSTATCGSSRRPAAQAAAIAARRPPRPVPGGARRLARWPARGDA